MSITVANVITDLNDELTLSESTDTASTAIKKAMSKAVRWLSKRARWSCLHHSKEDYSTSEGDESIAWPDNFRVLDGIVVNDGTYDSKPLTKITYNKWLKRRADETTADYDEPEEYADRGEKFYLDPLPDSNDGNNYTIKVWYWRWHPAITAVDTTILFGDVFKEAIVAATIAAYLDGKDRHVKAQYYWGMAGNESDDLKRDHADKKLRNVKYRDLG